MFTLKKIFMEGKTSKFLTKLEEYYEEIHFYYYDTGYGDDSGWMF